MLKWVEKQTEVHTETEIQVKIMGRVRQLRRNCCQNHGHQKTGKIEVVGKLASSPRQISLVSIQKYPYTVYSLS